MEASELDLVRRVRQGDAEAFQPIVATYSRRLFKAAWRVLGDAEAAEDAVQEAFLRAWRAFSTFDERAELATWLYRIAVNAAVDQARSRRRRAFAAAEIPLNLDGEPTAATEEPGPERKAASSEAARRIRGALAELPSTERTAFLLRHFEGRSIAEIAQALGKRENAAKQSIFRAVRKLRRTLGPLVELQHGEPA